MEENKLLKKVDFFFSLHWTILSMSLQPFWASNVVVTLLSMEGQKTLGFHQKYLNLCSKELRSYGFVKT